MRRSDTGMMGKLWHISRSCMGLGIMCMDMVFYWVYDTGGSKHGIDDHRLHILER
jgi:hypothetical protein